MAKGEIICPNGPKALRVKAEQESAKRTRAPEQLAKDLFEWACKPGQFNLRHFTIPYGLRISKLEEMGESCAELKEAIKFAREVIGSNLSDEWHEKPHQEKFAVRHMEFYDESWMKFMERIRAQNSQKVTGAMGIIEIRSDKLGIVASESKE